MNQEERDYWLYKNFPAVSRALEAIEATVYHQDVYEELAAATDPFAPDWTTAPTWAEYHTIDEDGTGCWWGNAGIVLGADAWYHDAAVLQHHIGDTHTYDLTGLDWRNSLRARPARKDTQP